MCVDATLPHNDWYNTNPVGDIERLSRYLINTCELFPTEPQKSSRQQCLNWLLHE